jgi:hypothetical protein
MIVLKNGTRFNDYRLYETRLHARYDYANEGLLRHLISPRIRDTKNKVLQFILAYVEQSLIFSMKSVDILQNFHNYNWKNR